MKIASLLLNLFNLAVLAFSFVALIPSAMLFDSPGSTANKSLWFLLAVFGAFPLVVLVSLILSCIKWGGNDFGAALKWGVLAPVYALSAGVCLMSILKW